MHPLAWENNAQHPTKKQEFYQIYNLFISLLHLCYIMKKDKKSSLTVWESLLGELKASEAVEQKMMKKIYRVRWWGY